ELVRLVVAVVVEALVGRDDDVKRGCRDEGRRAHLDVALLLEGLCYVAAHLGVGDDDERLALREAAARRAPDRPDDPLDRFRIDRIGPERAVHPPLREHVAELHRASLDAQSGTRRPTAPYASTPPAAHAAAPQP